MYRSSILSILSIFCTFVIVIFHLSFLSATFNCAVDCGNQFICEEQDVNSVSRRRISCFKQQCNATKQWLGVYIEAGDVTPLAVGSAWTPRDSDTVRTLYVTHSGLAAVDVSVTRPVCEGERRWRCPATGRRYRRSAAVCPRLNLATHDLTTLHKGATSLNLLNM